MCGTDHCFQMSELLELHHLVSVSHLDSGSRIQARAYAMILGL